MSAAVMMLLGDPDRRLRMGQAAHEYVAGDFSLDAMVDRHLAVYGELERT